MPKGARERDHEIKRDSKEWKMKRIEMAYKEARRRLAGKKHLGKGDVGEEALYLLKKQSDYLDKLVAKELGPMAEGAAEKAKEVKKRSESVGSKAIGALASGYGKVKELKGTSSKDSDDSSKKSSSESSNPSLSGKSSAGAKLSLEDVMRDAHQVRSKRDGSDSEKSNHDSKNLRIGIKRDGSIRDIEKVVEKLRDEASKNKQRISFHELKIDHLTKDELKKFRQTMGENRKLLEDSLRERIGRMSPHEELKVGLVDNRVYVWKINRTPDDMLNVWGNRHFYFKEQEYSKLIDRLSSKLQLPEAKSERAQHLNKLIRNMVSEDPASRVLHREAKPRLVGDMLHFTRDILGVQNDYFEGKMEKLASRHGRGPIVNPKLLTGEPLRHWRAQVGATVNSDCWLGGDGRMYYYEANHDRIKIFQNQLQQIGDIELRLQPVEGRKSYRMYLPRPIGKAFIYWGFATDDKSTQNKRLSPHIRDGSPSEWKIYLRNLIPEDGSFNDVSGFQWSRSIVMNPGNQDSKYGLKHQLDSNQITFIKENGRRDDKRGYIHLQISEKIRSNGEPKSDVVKSLESVIDANRSKLLDDEVDLARKLGIEMRVYPESITIYEDTGRISIKWVATTLDADNTIKWFLIVPPDDIRKLEHAKEWMSKRSAKVERIRKQLEADGLL